MVDLWLCAFIVNLTGGLSQIFRRNFVGFSADFRELEKFYTIGSQGFKVLICFATGYDAI